MSGPAESAVEEAGVPYRIVRHGPARSLAEAARNQGVEPRDIVKTIVVRRADGEYLFVLVPGDRVISWPKLRALLGVSRLSMPDAADRQGRHRVRARHDHAVRLGHRLAGDRRRAAARPDHQPRRR